jgi:hypothetical protein
MGPVRTVRSCHGLLRKWQFLGDTGSGTSDRQSNSGREAVYGYLGYHGWGLLSCKVGDKKKAVEDMFADQTPGKFTKVWGILLSSLYQVGTRLACRQTYQQPRTP